MKISEAIPATYSKWKHKSGKCYKVLSVANIHADNDRKNEYPVTVIYQCISDHKVWSRTLDRWHIDFTELNTSTNNQ